MYGIEVKSSKMQFSSAHFARVNGKFEPLHGHNYKVICRIEGPLNEEYMVIDFGTVRTQLEQICKQLDHRVLIPEKSPYIKIQEKDGSIVILADKKLYAFPIRDVKLLPIEETSAELLAKYIHEQISLPCECTYSIAVSENEGSTAVYFG